MNALLELALDEQIALGKLNNSARPNVVNKGDCYVSFFFDRYGKQQIFTATTEYAAYNKAYKAALKTAGNLVFRRSQFNSKHIDSIRSELKRA